ncbi:CDP-glycerol glycerophosphotransferase family protein [Microlunatus parietis]|uniref:CDP-Glycerol:Poly(Glycerophosphate) glycerophosphotransferase n=1 Tax=Microlunatus parietis TaxID=682979 RepID=A0A7Y9IA89_9ACTN|nr:CDP-glycerol glycerophosphotransferase family protein [Microlunatus parietis]NYE72861.1 hypothetical protein [Microlunatus parietis]
MIALRARLGKLRRLPTDPFWHGLINLGAIAAVCLLLAGGGTVPVIIGIGCGLISLVLLVRRLRRPLLRPAGARAEVATVAARALLVLAVAAGAVLRRPEDAGWWYLAAGIAMLTVLTEPSVRTLLAARGQRTVQLPSAPAIPEPRLPSGIQVQAWLAVIVIGVILAAVGAPGWVWLVVALLAVPLQAVVGFDALRARLAERRAVDGVPAALAKYRPEFAVYYAASSGVKYQLGMWLPYLERLGRPYFVITRDASTVPAIAELTPAPILVPDPADVSRCLDRMVVPTLRAAFYVQGSPANQTFQRFRNLTHIWLNHGDSDKPANFHPRHASYDRLFVAGKLAIERYATHGITVPEEKFVLIGRPQIERIAVADDVPPGEPRTVFYAPTWRGGRESTNYCSLAWGAELVRALLDRGAIVIFRPHPLSHRDPTDAGRIAEIHRLLADDHERSGRPHRWGAAAEVEAEVADCCNAADALITDVSSVASDFLASGKPFAMITTKLDADAFRAEFKVAGAAYVIGPDLAGLAPNLDQLLGPDELRQTRLAFRTHCLGERLGPDAAEPFREAVIAILDRTSDTPPQAAPARRSESPARPA